MNIQNIKFFTTVANLENMSKAADLLHVSQSSLSKAISNLEKELGVALFDRNGKKIALNAQGARFLKSCQIILKEADGAKEDLLEISRGKGEKIRIWAACAPQAFYDCLATFRHIYSKTEYEIELCSAQGALPDINLYDAVIYPDDIRYSKFQGTEFFREKFRLAVPEKSPLAHRPSVSAKALNGQDFIFVKGPDGQSEYTYSICSALTVEMNSVSYTTSHIVQGEMIAAGLGIGFVSETFAQALKQSKKIVLLPIMDEHFSRNINICFKRDKRLTEQGRLFKEHFINYFGLK